MLNDLYMLDLTSMEWSLIDGDLNGSPPPQTTAIAAVASNSSRSGGRREPGGARHKELERSVPYLSNDVETLESFCDAGHFVHVRSTTASIRNFSALFAYSWLMYCIVACWIAGCTYTVVVNSS